MGRSATANQDGARGEPRILFVSDERGWPCDTGYRRRTAQIVSALASLGPVTWIAAPRGRSDGGGPVIVPDHLQDRIEAVLV
ncbi:MAG: hypothetical protein WBM50_18415, partial [Acidimicrobiales bacterium]